MNAALRFSVGVNILLTVTLGVVLLREPIPEPSFREDAVSKPITPYASPSHTLTREMEMHSVSAQPSAEAMRELERHRARRLRQNELLTIR